MVSGNPQNETYKLDSIEDALEEIKAGKVIIVVDDEDRETSPNATTKYRSTRNSIYNFY